MQMKKLIKMLLATILFFAILVYPYNQTYSAATDIYSAAADTDLKNAGSISLGDNKEIRVGLFFKDQSKNLNTETAYFDISAQKGIKIGYNDEKNKKSFEAAILVNDNNKVRIRKDTYFINKDNSLIEYNPDTDLKSTSNENKIGPFHIEIGNNYSDYNNAKDEANKIKEKGIYAYPVYNSGLWCIWTGFYIDKESALTDIDKTIKKELGNKDYIVTLPNKNNIVVEEESGEVLAICTSENGYFQIHPEDENVPYIFNINGKTYRGIIEVRRLQQSDMTVINILPVEHYLYGVVPCEIGWEAHPEALKAQAVVARTYTYSNLGKYSNIGFDLCSTVNSQVYKGYDFEKESTNKAVNDTKGKVIYYNDDIAKVFYFSSSGGRTETIKNVWSSDIDIPYLQSVEDKYESGNSYNYNWEKSFTTDEIRTIIASRGNSIGNILGVNISKTSEAGRAIEVIIIGSKGEVVLEKIRTRDVLGLPSQWYNITASNNANILVWDNNIKSAVKVQLSGKKVITDEGLKDIRHDIKIFLLAKEENIIEITAIPTMFTFTGKGYGHAVGMSQEGAKGMAVAGFTFEEILRHYFTGAYVE